MPNYNCLDLPDHQALECPGTLGGIDSYAVLLPGWEDEITDLEDEVQWQSAIDAGLAKIVKGVKGELGEPSAVDTENVRACGTENILAGHDHEASIRDFNISSANSAFYDGLKRVKAAGIAIGLCDGKMIVVRNKPQFYVSGTPVVPESNREQLHYPATVHWYEPVSGDSADFVEKPDGIFDE